MALWYKTCAFCGQGRLFVYFDEDANSPYLHCEECEYGFRDPLKVEKSEAFLTLLEDCPAHAATAEEVSRFPQWEELVLNDPTTPGDRAIRFVSEAGLHAGLEKRGAHFRLDTGIDSKSSFFRSVRTHLPLDPPLESDRSWDALADSLWEGLCNLGDAQVTIVWPGADEMSRKAPDAYRIALDTLEGLVSTLADPQATVGKPTQLRVFVVAKPPQPQFSAGRIQNIADFAVFLESASTTLSRIPGDVFVAPELWVEIAANADLIESIVMLKDLPDVVLRAAAVHESPRVRSLVARKRTLPPDLFKALAGDSGTGVRLAIARNQKTPRAVLESLADDPWDTIRDVIRTRLREPTDD